MREIKFRVWGVDVNGEGDPRMYFIRDIRDTDCSRRAFYNLEDEDINELNPWMQYTGLRDKNGVEIYEGDIVSIIASPVVIEMGGDSAGYIEPGLIEPPRPYVEKATPPRLLKAEVRISSMKGVQLLVRKAEWAEDQSLLELFNEPFSDTKYSENWSMDEFDADDRIDSYKGKRLQFRKKDIVEVIGNIYENPELLGK